MAAVGLFPARCMAKVFLTCSLHQSGLGLQKGQEYTHPHHRGGGCCCVGCIYARRTPLGCLRWQRAGSKIHHFSCTQQLWKALQGSTSHLPLRRQLYWKSLLFYEGANF